MNMLAASSKAYDPGSLHTADTFGFRGEGMQLN